MHVPPFCCPSHTDIWHHLLTLGTSIVKKTQREVINSSSKTAHQCCSCSRSQLSFTLALAQLPQHPNATPNMSRLLRKLSQHHYCLVPTLRPINNRKISRGEWCINAKSDSQRWWKYCKRSWQSQHYAAEITTTTSLLIPLVSDWQQAELVSLACVNYC